MENLLLLFLVLFVFWSFLWSAPCGKRTARHSPSPDLVLGV